jgi:hypothetical protein
MDKMIPNCPYQSLSPIKAFKFPSDNQVKVIVDVKTPRRIWEMVQQLEALNALSEGRIPQHHMVAYNYLQFHFQEIFWPLWVPGTQMMYIHTCRQNTNT